MVTPHPFLWLGFAATIALLLGFDLGVLNRGEAMTLRRSIRWSAVVIAAAALFGVAIWWRAGRADAVLFATGYLVEFTLSVDNLLVFVIVLRYFAVPEALHATVLKWGILGALIMRAAVIGAGTLILRQLDWVIYALGALLLFTGVKLLARPAEDVSLEKNAMLRIARRALPISRDFAGRAFVVREAGRLVATPLLLVVLVVEWTDLVFATDSIPAIFAITRDPFLVYSSNVFAIVGLRALFFVLAAVIARFVYLRHGVAVVLMFVGLKMVVARWIPVSPLVSLGVIVAVLAISVAVSAKRTTS